MTIGQTADRTISFKGHPRCHIVGSQLGVLINHFITSKFICGTNINRCFLLFSNATDCTYFKMEFNISFITIINTFDNYFQIRQHAFVNLKGLFAHLFFCFKIEWALFIIVIDKNQLFNQCFTVLSHLNFNDINKVFENKSNLQLSIICIGCPKGCCIFRQGILTAMSL